MLRLLLALAGLGLYVTGWDLYATLSEQAQYKEYYDTRRPVACPNDGTPLKAGPPQRPDILWCPFDFWEWPRDWDMETMSGM